MSKVEPGTPLPWRNFKAGIGEADGASIISLWREGAERDANAAYIVHACNAYPALVEQAEALAGALTELIAAIDRRWEGETERKRANSVSPRMDDAMDEARAVLAELGRIAKP